MGGDDGRIPEECSQLYCKENGHQRSVDLYRRFQHLLSRGQEVFPRTAVTVHIPGGQLVELGERYQNTRNIPEYQGGGGERYHNTREDEKKYTRMPRSKKGEIP